MTTRRLHINARSVIGIGCWILVILVFAMVLYDKTLLDSDAFLILATAIVITGWVNGPVSWAYAATEGGGKLADKNAAMVERAAEVIPAALVDKNERPQDVRVVNKKIDPVPTDPAPEQEEELPDYARG